MLPKSFASHQFIPLHSPEKWLEKARIAGKTVASCLSTSKKLLENQEVSNGLELSEICGKIIKETNCTATFLGYKGFPAPVCLSVGSEVVHGIPSDRSFQTGDVIKVDLGATFEGAIADAARTFIYGGKRNSEVMELINVCQGALEKATAAVKVGAQIGSIGYAIQKYISARSRFSIVTDYGGHGISYSEIGKEEPHISPFVANRSQFNVGARIQPGMVIAIEPIVGTRSNKTSVKKDGWTVVGEKDSLFAHFEDTLFVLEDRVEVITKD